MAVGDQGKLAFVLRKQGGKTGDVGFRLHIDPVAQAVDGPVEIRVVLFLVQGQDVVDPGDGMNALLFQFSLAVLDLGCCTLLSLVMVSRGCFLVAARGLLIVVSSLIMEQRF